MNDPHDPACNRHLCILPWIHMFIKQNSQVYPCCFGSEVHSFGDVRDSDVMTIANDEPMKAIRRTMLAGEPLIMKEHYMILERLIALGRTHVRLSYNTNMSVLRYKDKDIVDLWKRFDHVQLGISVDGIGKRAEYIRKGTVWPTFLQNIETVRSACPHVTIRGNLTITVFNVMTFADIFRYLDAADLFDGKPLDINFLNDPPFYSVQILPPAMKSRAAASIGGLVRDLETAGRNSEAADARAIVNFMNAYEAQDKIKDFFNRTDKLDAFRGECFEDSFPELRDLRAYGEDEGTALASRAGN